MGILGFLILGLIAGAIAKAILPGRQGGGWVMTLVLGVVGAILGGWIGSLIFGGGLAEFFDIRTWLRLGLEYSYENRNSTDAASEFSRNIVLLTIGGTL